MDPLSNVDFFNIYTDYAISTNTRSKNATQLDPYQKCLVILQSLEFEEAPLELFFQDMCAASGDLTIEHLKKTFTQNEIIKITAILEWYHVALVGCLPSSDLHKDEPRFVKKLLDINTYLEIIQPSRECREPLLSEYIQPESSVTSFTFDQILHYVCDSQLPTTGNYYKCLVAIKEAFICNTSAEGIIENLHLCLDLVTNQGFSQAVFEMPIKQRIRWAILVAVMSQYCDNDEFLADFFKEKETVAAMSEPFRTHLEFLFDSFLFRSKEKRLGSFHCVGGQSLLPICMQDFETVVSPRVTFTKLDYPHLPNWMPNAGNTCYISTVLWALALMVPEKLREKIEAFAADEAFLSDPEKEARLSFKNLYEQLIAPERTSIPLKQVSDFRRAMQKAYPERFMAPHQNSQEDAYELLAAILQNLLGIDCTTETAAKFSALHTFEPINQDPFQEPDLYDYAGAFAPSLSKQFSYVLDISLDKQALDDHVKKDVYLKDLVTTCRQTDERERHAYRKPQEHVHDQEEAQTGKVDAASQEVRVSSNVKYQCVMAHHKEQFVIESPDTAPPFFCGRIARFSLDYETGVTKKRFDTVYPNAFLEFSTIRDPDIKVAYDLIAITVHSGPSINAGHYYTYFRQEIDGVMNTFKYDDIAGPELCHNEQKVLQDSATNGYIFYYKKRAQNAPHVEEFVVQNAHASVMQDIKPIKPACQLFALEWLKNNKLDKFSIDEAKGIHPAFDDKAKEVADFNELALQLQQSVYLIDPVEDRDLYILDDGYVIPGDTYRFGEKFSSNGVQYIFKQQDRSYLALKVSP